MKKITKIQPQIPTITKRKRVAPYARVSVESERMQHSLSAQVSYYNSYIQKNPEWEFAGIYADYGISGTSLQKRDEFNRMLSDCEAGKIDLILTKSIQRFARNTVDLLRTVRHLKELGIEVRFEKENINSLSGDGELMLSILASFAEEESRSISANCKWGIRKRFASGEIGTANKHILGYRYDKELRKYVVIPDEAEIVRKMFAMYIEGVSLRKIADKLNSHGYRTVHGKLFMEGSLASMLKNEVYVGDIRRQKSYMTDPITKKKVKNQGEFPQYYIPDCHEAIIDRETYAKALAEMERRKCLINPIYCFTGKIKCGICGMNYTRKKSVYKGNVKAYWICRAKKEHGIQCQSPNIKEERLYSICAKVLGLQAFDEELFLKEVKEITILENGNILFRFYHGRNALWQG